MYRLVKMKAPYFYLDDFFFNFIYLLFFFLSLSLIFNPMRLIEIDVPKNKTKEGKE